MKPLERWSLGLGLLAACSQGAGRSDAGAGIDGATLADAAVIDRASHDADAPDAALQDGAQSLADAVVDGAPRDARASQPACFDGDAGCTRAMTLAEAYGAYKGWAPLLAEPQAISTAIAGLCRIPTANELAFVDSVHGQNLWLQYRLSPLAASIQPDSGVYLASDARYPVGAAIMKEKLTRSAEGAFTLVALGAMIKQPPGFDPAHGDWEFGYWEPAVGWHAAAETAHACGDCHDGAPSDHVFLDFRWHEPDAPAFPGLDASTP